MENIICTKCGNQTHFESKFCIFCGNNLEEIKSQLTNEDSTSYFQPSPQHYETERKTFFCPKCMLKIQSEVMNVQIVKRILRSIT